MRLSLALFPMLDKVSKDSIFLDPASGVGDLLIQCSKHLPIDSSLTKTLTLWGKKLFGCEIKQEFVKTCKLRLVLAAIQRGVQIDELSLPDIDLLLPGIKCQSGLDESDNFSVANYIVINPPFTLVDSPDECQWAQGAVNCAAVFMEYCINNAKPGTNVVAILPEVLRSGSRYSKCRKFVESKCHFNRIDLCGQFDRWADVDVFVMDSTIKKKHNSCSVFDWGYPHTEESKTVRNFFKISVGSVVPYRDEEKGRWFPFICSHDLPAWETVETIKKHRRFLGRTFKPPFVAVRRTSRPGDKYRAIGTIINNKKLIAVENHLIVLKPKDGSIATCKKLIKLFKAQETNDWLNKRICCRHLTVSSLADLPWKDVEK